MALPNLSLKRARPVDDAQQSIRTSFKYAKECMDFVRKVLDLTLTDKARETQGRRTLLA
jgi:hypothetical protein